MGLHLLHHKLREQTVLITQQLQELHRLDKSLQVHQHRELHHQQEHLQQLVLHRPRQWLGVADLRLVHFLWLASELHK